MARLPDDLIRFWRALDDRLSEVSATRWGALVTDPRFPAIWDANYARIDRPVEHLDLREVRDLLVPALQRAGAETFHVVSFFAEESRGILTELSRLGHTFSWDVVMGFHDGAQPDGAAVVVVEEIPPGNELWSTVEASLSLFDVHDPDAVRQLRRIEEEVMTDAKRWYGVRDGGELVSIAALVELEGVGYLDNVATFPGARGRGYASALTAHAVGEAVARGAASVYLLADPDGPLAMYGRIGFRELGRLASTRGPIPVER